jgi:prevent-host-death family protein
MKQVRISDLKAHLSEHVRAAEAGEIIEVMDRARAVARIVPTEREAVLELIPRGRKFASIRNIKLPRARVSMTSLEILRMERGSR